jgi:steroid 5-alpha reductase family enzyme
MTSTLTLLAFSLVLSCGVMFALWLVQRRIHNAGIVDIGWTLLTGINGVLFAAATTGVPWLRWLAGTMIAIWATRLAAYLAKRVIGHPEEGRYVTLRKQWGPNAQWRFFRFYQAQAVAAVGFATTVLAVAMSSTPPATWLVVLGVALWFAGIGGVTLADAQLARFKRSGDSHGRTCREGLWRYSRHPNYFFEWVHWCSYIPLAAASPWWWAPILVAGALLYFVLFVTGIPPTEAQAVASRGEDYRDYQRTTSAFIPWPPLRT